MITDISTLLLNKPIILAPMDGYTNIPFRLIIKEMNPDLMFTEFVNSDAVINENKKTLSKIRILNEERPVAIQIFGHRPENMAIAAKIIEEIGPELIDINFGCPAPKVSGHGSGSALLKDLPLVSKICESVVNAVKTPVSAKTRLGWDNSNINILQTAKIFEESGIKFMTLHPRTKVQKFNGKSDWNYIKKVKEQISIPLIGNGDICSPEDALNMFLQTNCDGIMIGREAVKNPWIFKQIKDFLRTGSYTKEIPFDERKRLCLKHFDLSMEYLGEVKGLLEMRKLYQNYFKAIPNLKSFKQKVFCCSNPPEIRDLILNFEDNSE
ncbi:MAG: tRNA dihydrouridine synthase DusB [Candidatus Delongbacteria bacterium]|nr:tRNA dihydrouridine synthase DusB [Candidatus Delongbacteria bacterium]MCG2760996.1 tRNA dihydrouridine synthase DusB [Candidatus Delongbacteria bacterium]